jgi:NitT/TauT family transport system substrate-binding protein
VSVPRPRKAEPRLRAALQREAPLREAGRQAVLEREPILRRAGWQAVVQREASLREAGRQAALEREAILRDAGRQAVVQREAPLREAGRQAVLERGAPLREAGRQAVVEREARLPDAGRQAVVERAATLRRVGWLAGVVALAVLVAGCGGSAAPSGGGVSGAAQASSAAGASAGSAAEQSSRPAGVDAGGAPVASGGGAGYSTSPLNPAVKVKLGVLKLASEGGAYIAQERGYFKDEGLEVEFVPFNNGSQEIPLLGTGQLDVGSGSPDANLMNAVARGIDVKIVASYLLIRKNSTASGFVVRQDLIDSGKYKQPKDLRGMTVAVSSRGGTGETYPEIVLAQGGLTANDVNMVVMPFADMLAALTNKKVDAAWLAQPYVINAEQQHVAKMVVPSGEILAGTNGLVMYMGGPFTQQKPEVARRFMTAFLRGQRDYYRAFDLNEGPKDDILNILAKYTRTDPKLGAELAQNHALGGVDPNGGLNVRWLDSLQDDFIRLGSQKERVDLARALDQSEVDAALQRLGKVQDTAG